MIFLKNQYEYLAQAYDELMYDVEYDQWACYIIELIKEQSGNTSQGLLEYACGTGNITIELLKEGFDIVALDNQEAMLSATGEKLRKQGYNAKLVCADMVDFKLTKKVSTAVCACDGVNYILTKQKLKTFFNNVYRNLEEAGAFLFDISSEYKLKEVLADEFFYDDSDEQTLFWQNSYDFSKKMIYMDITLFINKVDSYKRYDEQHIQKAWNEQEIIELLSEIGFLNVKSYAFGTKMPTDTKTKRIQFVAVK